MISIAISIAIVALLFKQLEATQDFSLDAALAVVIAPAIVNFLFGFAAVALGLPAAVGYAGLLLFLLMPFAIMRWLLDATIRASVIGAAATFITIIVVQTAFLWIAPR